MRAEVERMAHRVAASLEKKKLMARSVTLKLRYSDFTTVTRATPGIARRATRPLSPRAPPPCWTAPKQRTAKCACWA
jgi:nucleotidyltransferase/DNA polymerase involved in DNA repair